jgi:hypothetical protein
MSSFYIEVVKYGLMPIALSLVAAILWYFYYLYKKMKYEIDVDLSQNLKVTIFVIIYLMYPTISNVSFSLLNCQTLDDGKSYLKRDYSIECWAGSHKGVGVTIALVFIIFWVIGFPLFIFYKLFHQRKNLND